MVEPPSYLQSFAEQSEPFTADKLEGRQLFFNELRKGVLFFAFPCRKDQLMHVVARANGPVRVYKMKILRFIHFLKDNPLGRRALTRAFSQWFSSFPPFFSKYRHDYPTSILHAGQKIKLLVPSILVSAHKPSREEEASVIWLHVIEGEVTLAGIPHLTLTKEEGLIYPLVSEIWLKNNSVAELEVLSDEKIDYSEKYWKGLLRFHLDALLIFADLETEKMKEEGQKAQLFRALDQKKVTSSLTELEHVLDKDYLFKETGKDLLYETCQLVGDRLYLNFTPSKELNGELSPPDRLMELCLDSQIYFRKIKHTEGWWKADLGPLIGFLGPELKPVALFPASSNAYEMVDLAEKKKYRVDENVDSRLFKHLFMLYRTLPSKPSLTGKEVAYFALRNKHRELLWALFFGFVSMMMALFIPFATKIIFSTAIPFSDESLLFQLTLGLILISLGTAFFKYFREAALLRFQALLAHDLQTGIWQRIFNLPMRFFEILKSAI